MKKNSRIYTEAEFMNVEVSGHNLESSKILGFVIPCLHYKPVSTTFARGEGGGGMGVKSVNKGDCE
jgi:hypothetical protein